MLAIAVVSFLFAKQNHFGDSVSQFLSKILLFVINPCVIINSFNKPFNQEKLQQFLIIFVISLVVHFVMIFIGIVSLRSKDDLIQKQNDLDKIAIVFTNCGFIGIPLIHGIYGSDGVFLLMGYLTAFNIVFWTYAVYIMEHKVKIGNIFLNPNIIATIIGGIIFCIPFKLPDIIVKITTPIADMNTAGAMILLGILFAIFSESKEGLGKYIKRLSLTSFLRLIISPIFVLIVLWFSEQIFSNISDIQKMLFVIFISAAGPVGMNISSFAVLYKRDTSYSSILVLLTSVFCIITLPLFVKLAEIVL